MSAGLGYALGGATQGFGQGQQYAENIQNSQATSTIGAAARQLAGVAPSSQGEQSQTPQTPQLNTQAQAPQQTGVLPQQQPPQAQPGVARSPMPQPAPTQATIPPPQPNPQPPTANTSSPLPQAQPQQSTPPQPQAQSQGTAQLSQQTQQPPQQQQPFQPHPQAQGQGPWTMQDLTRAILKSNPNISDRALGMALFKASPLLNQQGLEAYRGLGMQLRQGELGLRQEEFDYKKKHGADVESDKASAARQKEAQQQENFAREVAGRQLTADIAAASTGGGPPDPEKMKAAQEKYQKAVDEAKSKYDESSKPKEDGGGGETIMYNGGKAYKYKGSGDSKDPKNWEPLD